MRSVGVGSSVMGEEILDELNSDGVGVEGGTVGDGGDPRMTPNQMLAITLMTCLVLLNKDTIVSLSRMWLK